MSEIASYGLAYLNQAYEDVLYDLYMEFHTFSSNLSPTPLTESELLDFAFYDALAEEAVKRSRLSEIGDSLLRKLPGTQNSVEITDGNTSARCTRQQERQEQYTNGVPDSVARIDWENTPRRRRGLFSRLLRPKQPANTTKLNHSRRGREEEINSESGCTVVVEMDGENVRIREILEPGQRRKPLGKLIV